MPILRLKTCVRLGLIEKLESSIAEIETQNTRPRTSNPDKVKREFVAKNTDLFSGLGTYPDEYKILLKDDVQPKINSCRRVPDIIEEKLKVTLEKLEKKNVLEKVDYPTDWVNDIVIVEKVDKSIRICLDPCPLNDCIKKEAFPIPSIEELSAKLTGKKLFTVIYMKDGFHQVELHEESKELCTFITPFGKYKYKRLPFRVSRVTLNHNN